ncbi:DUF2178 domain-containing protein [Patescibacteria group bacterium]|nr:DUF2178 domain-containing protein [Patescibacteria group bacterium]
MNRKTYNQIRAVIAVFISFVVSLAVTRDSYVLAIIGVLTGMLFLIIVRTKTKITVDEREVTIREKAARLTYAIFAPTIGLGSLILLMPSKSGLSVFSKGEFTYLESLGTVLAYLTLFMIATYAISYHFINKKLGGGNNEE